MFSLKQEHQIEFLSQTWHYIKKMFLIKIQELPHTQKHQQQKIINKYNEGRKRFSNIKRNEIKPTRFPGSQLNTQLSKKILLFVVQIPTSFSSVPLLYPRWWKINKLIMFRISIFPLLSPSFLVPRKCFYLCFSLIPRLYVGFFLYL